MRLRQRSPLLLFLLAPSLISAQLERVDSTRQERLSSGDPVDVLTNEEILALNHAPKNAPSRGSQPAQDAALLDDVTSTAPASSTATRRYVGTEDAPVDGLDGKPHAGPFVDRTPDNGLSLPTSEKAVPTSLKKFETAEDESWRLSDIPEKNDGVMNDENRQIPKKGTTGTEGGISEKEKLKASRVGVEKEPQGPRAAPPLPYSEEKKIEAAEEKTSGKSEKTKKISSDEQLTGEAETTQTSKSDRAKQSKLDKETKDAVTGKPVGSEKKSDEYGEGGHLLEKPKDLPKKPHDIPIPEPKIATQPGTAKGDGPPIASDERGRMVMTDMPDTDGRTNRDARKTPIAKTTTTTTSASNLSYDEMDWHEWVHSFVLSFTMIIFSEIGDKTFLVAALMAMRHARWVVFSAALSALVAMTVLSAVLGHAFPTLLPRKLTTFAAAVLFFVFGAKSLREGLAMDPHAGMGEEMKEVEAELEEKEHTMARRQSRAGSGASPYTLEAGRGRSPGGGKSILSPPQSPSPSRGRQDRLSGLTNLMSLVLSPAWVQTFIMTFLGEWGDRSQIATIAMAAGQDYWWVTLGAILGHACCTGLAVIGGRALAGRVSMRVVTIGGAVAFLVFGVIYLYECTVE